MVTDLKPKQVLSFCKKHGAVIADRNGNCVLCTREKEKIENAQELMGDVE
jgi:hypothetical protein